MQEKKALSSRGRGRLRGFLELRRPWGFSPEARRGSQGASRAAPGKSGLHARGEGERVLALESREGTRASRRVEEGLSRSLSGGGGKPSCPSPSAGDLRELPRVPLRGEGSCGGGGAPRDSAGSGATEEGLTSRGGRHLRLPLRFGLRPQGPCKCGVLTTGPPGNFPITVCLFFFLVFLQLCILQFIPSILASAFTHLTFSQPLILCLRKAACRGLVVTF